MKSDLNILFLFRKYYYLYKMSRVRFNAVKAIGKRCQVVWSGPEWENWNSSKPVQDNINDLYRGKKQPDLILCYKPHEITGLADVTIPTSIAFDEMVTEELPAEETVSVIKDTKIDWVISHQKKQLEHPLFKKLPCKFSFIPYSFDASIFKDYHKNKEIDVLLIGNLAPSRYPMRHKLYKTLLKMREDKNFLDFNLVVYQHPGYHLKEAYSNKYVIDYAQHINASKICLTCCGKYHLKYPKYIEVPACRSLLIADMPQEDQDLLQQHMVTLDPDEPYESIVKKIRYYIEHEEERIRLTDIGYTLVHKRFTQDHYAKHFIDKADAFLRENQGKKIWR